MLPDPVNRHVTPTRPNQFWVGDITSVRTQKLTKLVTTASSRRVAG